MAEPSFIEWIVETARVVQDRVRDVVQGVDAWAASDGAAGLAAFFDSVSIEHDVAQYFAATGWYVPRHPTLMVPLLRDRREHRPFHPARLVDLVGPSSAHWPWISEGLLASPSVASRRQIVGDALWALDQCRWAAAVSTLAPLIEGLLTDRTGDHASTSVGAKIDALLDRPASEFETLSAIGVLLTVKREMYKRTTFSASDVARDDLHRHVILHGRSGGFGTEWNAVRLLTIVAAIVETFDGPLAERSSSAPPHDVAGLLDFAPLITAQQAHAARRKQSGPRSD